MVVEVTCIGGVLGGFCQRRERGKRDEWIWIRSSRSLTGSVLGLWSLSLAPHHTGFVHEREDTPWKRPC